MFWGCTSVCAFIHYLRLCAGILEWLVVNFSCIYKKLMAVDEYTYNLLCLKKIVVGFLIYLMELSAFMTWTGLAVPIIFILVHFVHFLFQFLFFDF